MCLGAPTGCRRRGALHSQHPTGVGSLGVDTHKHSPKPQDTPLLLQP